MSDAGRVRIGRWTAVLVASLATHVVALSALHIDPSIAAKSALSTIDVSFSIVSPPTPVTADEPEPAEPRVPENVEPQEPLVTPRRSRANAASDRPRPSEPSPIVPTPTGAKQPVSLDPESVARAFILVQEGTSSDASEVVRQGSAGAEHGSEDEPPNYFEGVGAKRYLSVRDPPKLKRHKDGTHSYRGHGFAATVAKDGSVSFDDKYAQGVTVRFDITDRMMKRRGEDPYRVEKNWFMEGTETFRQELFERWRAKQILVSVRKLRVRLLHISENEALGDQEKAERVLALFQDTADDEAGAAARDAITEFVAERMPKVTLPSD